MWLEELHLEALGLRCVHLSSLHLILRQIDDNIFRFFVSNVFRSDFVHKLAVSVITNNSPALRTIDLSHNLIEDKGKIIDQ